MQIPRSFERTEHDDYILNVQPHLDRDENMESVRIYEQPKYDSDGKMINSTRMCLGWKIQMKFD